MRSGPVNSVLAILAIAASCSPGAAAATPLKLTGSIAGIVRDNTGIPQMGATVLLFNHYERIIQRSLTNERGAFGFVSLNPETYSVRVSLASFVPAMKHQISVQPGMQSLLYINMASLLSSIELVYAAPGQGALMSDDWKWTLKTATSTRPVLRILPQISISDPQQPQHTSEAIFSETRGVLKVSGGEADAAADFAEPDLGTAFALATSLFGRSKLQVSGNVAYSARSGLPATSFRTSYSRDSGGPQVAVTMRQVYLGARAGNALATGQTDGLPALRTISVAMLDRLELLDDLHLEYGISLDSVSFIEHLNYLSPFARLTYDLGHWGALKAAYSSGAPPAELFSRNGEADTNLRTDMSNLSLGPRISLRNAHAEVQRTQSLELGYEKKLGSSRKMNLTAYREIVANGALTMAGDESLFPAGETLPSLSSNGGTFDIGSYQRYGYSACIAQTLGDSFEFVASSGRGGVLMANNASPVESGSGDEIRSRIHTGQRYWAAARISVTLPRAGTQISTSYQWTDYNTLLPSHLYLTQNLTQEAGWNVHIRQPIPGFLGMPGRMEATADLRNMLAQGYIGLSTLDSRRLLLMQSPRAFRGGLSFIF